MWRNGLSDLSEIYSACRFTTDRSSQLFTFVFIEMTRHGRNATASTVYSYHEKKKDTKSSGYGTESARLGKDSIKEFDCCSLTLQPCRDPVITKEGHLYEKEAILECLLRQKQENAKKLKAYEKQVKELKTTKIDFATPMGNVFLHVWGGGGVGCVTQERFSNLSNNRFFQAEKLSEKPCQQGGIS